MSLEKVHSHLRAHVHHRLSFLAVAAALALVLNLMNAQVKALAQEQALPDQTAPVVQPDTSQPVQPSSPPPSELGPQLEGDNGEERPQEDIIDPREIINTLRDIKRLRQELKGLARQITRLTVANKNDLLAKVKEMDNELASMEKNIKNPPADLGQRGALQEFYDARMWDQVEDLRVRIQLPKELKDIARSITKIEKMLKLKAFQKLGLDMAKLTELLNTIKTAHTTVQTAYNAGDFEGAREAMQTFWEEGMHPGGFEGALHRIRGIKEMIRQIRDKEVIAAIEEMMAPVYEALYDGDFNEVHNVLQEYEDDLRRLANLIIRSRLKLNKVESKLSNLEELIRGRFESLEQQAQEKENQRKSKEEAPAPQPAPTQ